MAAIPVLAGLVAGTGAVTAFVTSSEPPAANANVATITVASPVATPTVPSPTVERPCATQTWPYIDQKCIAVTASTPDKRTVRVVMAPRANEPESSATSGVIPNANISNAALAEPALGSGKFDLISRGTVLRQPDSIEPKQANEARAPSRAKAGKTARDQRQRAERRWTAQSYAVPADPAYRTEAARPVIIIRPLPLSSYSSR